MNPFRIATALLLVGWVTATPLEAQGTQWPTAPAEARPTPEAPLFPVPQVPADVRPPRFDSGRAQAAGPRLSASGGLGWATRGPAGHLAANYQWGGNLLGARGAGTVAVFGDPLWDLGLLCGRHLSAGVAHVSLGAGVGVVGGETRESIHGDPAPLPTTFGVPIQAQLFLRPLPILGVGLYGFGNVNREESFTGLTAAVKIGRLW